MNNVPLILAAGCMLLLGAAVGSFLNVVVHRVPRGLSVVSPPSACPGCDSAIAPYDNIPVVSWIVLRARCRTCGTRISARYPLVEAGTALAVVGVGAFFVPAIVQAGTVPATIAALLVLVAHLWLVAASVALALIDLDTHTLPNRILLPTLVVAAVSVGAAAALTGQGDAIVRSLIAGAALFALYYVLALVTPGAMGFGDVKLAGILGLYLGWAGWPAVIVGAVAPFLLGGLFALGLLALRRAGRRDGIPFGPWMLVGAWIGIVAGRPIADAYLSLAGLA